MSARRNHKRREWPRGLYEPRPGYFVFRHPDGRTFALGRIPLAVARNEALSANAHIAATKPGLVDRLTGATQTIAELLDKLPVSTVKSTRDNHATQDKQIRAALGHIRCDCLTVADVAQFVEGVEATGHANSAAKLRSRLKVMCQRGQSLGWMETNPAAATQRPRVKVQRTRLTLETFQRVHAVAGQVAPWLPHAMMLALVSGQDRSTLTALRRADVDTTADLLHIVRPKTGARIDIPLSLRLDVVDVTLRDLVTIRPRVVSPYLLHYSRSLGRAKLGERIKADRVSVAFAEARRIVGIEDSPSAPTFHEIRSLAARLYAAQGGVDVKALLGHKTEAMTSVYKDARGIEAVLVKVA